MRKRQRKKNSQIEESINTTPLSGVERIQHQVDPTYFSSPTTQEDWYWGRYESGTMEDVLWRRLSDNFYLKDVIPSIYLEIHNQCYEAYNANPLAFAVIEQTTSFVLGEGIKVSANNKRVQQVIDAFWDNPENRMEERVYNLCTELSLYGEQFIHFFVNQYDGSVVIRQIDPSLIDQIETDQEDVEKPLRFHRRPIGQVMAATSGDPPPVTITQMEVDNQGTWFAAGDEVLQVTINKVSNAKRGKSDLATLLPWLRRYKDWLTDRVRINKYKGTFLWDVALTGADKKTIDRKKMEYSYPPEPGSVLIHNEAEKWTAVQPNINAMDAKEDGRQVKLMVAVGATLPEHFLSDGDQGNRATAAEMSLPTLLKFKRRQRVMKYMLERIIDRVILEAQKAGKLGKGARVDTSYEITFPEIDSGEHQTLAQATNLLVTALANAASKGWVSSETAMKMMFEFAGEEVDIEEELEKVAQERAAQLAQHLAMQKAMQGIQQPGSPGQQPQPTGQPTMVPNQRSLDRQAAEANPAQVQVDTNGFGNANQPLVNYGATFGDGTKGLSGGNGRK
jgi:hypothetical protein